MIQQRRKTRTITRHRPRFGDERSPSPRIISVAFRNPRSPGMCRDLGRSHQSTCSVFVRNLTLSIVIVSRFSIDEKQRPFFSSQTPTPTLRTENIDFSKTINTSSGKLNTLLRLGVHIPLNYSRNRRCVKHLQDVEALFIGL